MGRIQRMKQGSLPSAVVATPAEAPSLADDIVGALGEVAKVGYGLAVKSEAAEMRKIAAADKLKKTIVDTIEVGAMASGFNDSLYDLSGSVQKEYANSPEKAAEAFMEQAQQLVGATQKEATNKEVELGFARSSNSQIMSGVRGIHSWTSKQQTENAKSDLTTMENRMTRTAEKYPSVGVLHAELSKSKEAVKVLFGMGYGAEGDKKANELFSAMSWAYVNTRLDSDPRGVLKELELSEGPLVDYLDEKQRGSLRDKAKSAIGGLRKEAENAAVKSEHNFNGQVSFLFEKGELDGRMQLAMQRKSEKLISMYTMSSALEPKEKEGLIAIEKKKLHTLNILGEAERKKTYVTAIDMDAEMGVLKREHDRLFSTTNGQETTKDLLDWVKFQDRLLIAFADGKISKTSFGVMSKSVATALPSALEGEEANVDGWTTWGTARMEGNTALIQNFKSWGVALTDRLVGLNLGDNAEAQVKTRVWIQFVRDFDNLSETEQANESAVKEVANNAFILHTGLGGGQ